MTYTNPSGGSSYFTVGYTQKVVETNFGCSGVTEYGSTTQETQYLVSSITLPDNTSYVFTYEQTPSPKFAGAVTGRLASVTLPTGGEIEYGYSGGSNGITCSDGSTATLTRTTPDGTWTYAHTESGSAWTTDITAPADPQGNEAYTIVNSQGIYETGRQIYQKQGGTFYETVYTCYNGASFPCGSTSITPPITQRTVTPVLGTEESQVNTYYNTYGLPTKIDEYDYGNDIVGAFKRETMTCYASLANTLVVDRPSYVLVYSATGNASNCSGTSGLVAEASYSYDSNGNLLTETHTNTTGSPTSISRSFTYGSYGVLQTATDFNGNPTSYSNFTCANNTAFPQTVSSGGLTTTLNWNCYGAVVTSVTDPNGQETTYGYDTSNNFWRLAKIGYPDGGSYTITYTDTQGAFTVAGSRSVTTSTNHVVTQTLDSLGRIEKSVDSQACNGASSTATISYDTLGRVSQVSNPYCTTSDPTYGLTTYGYDALNRVTSVQAPDGSTTSASYTSNPICPIISDPQGKQRTLCYDGLGRLTSVTEDPNGLNYSTTYTYDDLNDLTGVAQGNQTRTYNYDMLGRLTSAQTPEAGTTSYSYANSGHSCSGNPSAPCSRTDARSIITTYAYDSLNRLTSETYSDSTPTATFSYDQSSPSIAGWSGGTLANPLGRLTQATTYSGWSLLTAVVYSYDPVGRISSFWQCTPANCGTSSIWKSQYYYDLAGDISSWVHPVGFTITNTLNSAQQITQIASSLSDSTHPGTLAQNISYTPWGALGSLENGCVGSGCTYALETYSYNKRLQPSVIELGTTGSPAADSCLVYNYYADENNPTSCATPTQGTKDNGNVMGYWYQDNVNPYSHTAAYTYDSLNRLTGAVATPFGSGTISYNLNFNSYDRYGNMTCVTNAQTNGPCPNWAFNTTTNRLSTSGFSYDAAGNLLADGTGTGSHSFTWDAEGRMTSLTPNGSSTMTYNALGTRVYDIPQLSYLTDPAGKIQGGFWSAGEWNGGVWLGERLLAMYAYASNGTQPVYFTHANALDSSTTATGASGAPAGEILYYPWGQTWQDPGTFFGDVSWYIWDAIQVYDLAIDGFYTPFREYYPTLGRWMSPDPVGGDITNPQSLNRYAYVTNNPTSLTDPLGLQGGCMPGSEQAGMCRNGTYYPPGGPVNPYNPFTNPGWNADIFDWVELAFEADYAETPNGEPDQLLSGFDPTASFVDLILGLDSLPLSGMGPLLASLAPQIQSAQQNPCTQPILSAVNSFAGTNFTAADVQPLSPFNNGNTTNLIIASNALSAAQFNALQTGRYPLSPWTWLTGYGPTLHITGQTNFDPWPATFGNSNIGGALSVTFTAHIDYAFAYNPLGAVIHGIDVLLTKLGFIVHKGC